MHISRHGPFLLYSVETRSLAAVMAEKLENFVVKQSRLRNSVGPARRSCSPNTWLT